MKHVRVFAGVAVLSMVLVASAPPDDLALDRISAGQVSNVRPEVLGIQVVSPASGVKPAVGEALDAAEPSASPVGDAAPAAELEPVEPVPAPEPVVEVVPEPTSAPEPVVVPLPTDPGIHDLNARVHAAFNDGVPPQWRYVVSSLSVIGGGTSLAYPSGRVEISTYHASRDWDRLRAVVAHEVAHVIAFRYGSGEYYGAGPEGFPAKGPHPYEHWADCAAQVFTGYPLVNRVSVPCEPDAFEFARSWLTR